MKIGMRFMAGNIVDNILYFSNLQFNGLFGLDIDTGHVRFIDTFIETPIDMTAIHRKCLVYGRRLIFIPQRSDKVHIVDVDTFEQRMIKVVDSAEYYMISDAYIIGDKLYIFPAKKGQKALIISLDDYSTETLGEFNRWFDTEVPDSTHKNMVVCATAALRDNTVYMAIYNQNKVAQYNLDTNAGKIAETDVDKLIGLFSGSNGIWITSLVSGFIKRLDMPSLNYGTDGKEIYRLVMDMGDCVYAIPGNSRKIRLIHGDGAPRDIDYPEEFKNFEQSAAHKFMGYIMYNDEAYLFPYVHDHILIIGKDGLRVLHAVYECDPKDTANEKFMEIYHARCDYLQKVTNSMVSENSTYTLEAFVDWLQAK